MKITDLTKVKGTRDYYGLKQNALNITFDKLRNIAHIFGYEEISFPSLENEGLFSRSIGDDTDVVSKEMFKLRDKKNRHIVLRPEGTSSAVRLVIENKLIDLGQRRHLFYIGKMFRYERPQKGRQREFYQFGVEIFNENNYLQDCELILMGNEILKSFNISKYKLELNFIGSKETNVKYKEILKKYLKGHLENMSPDSQIRFDTNILRILDSKHERDQEIIKNAPSILKSLSEEEKKRFNLIKDELKNNNIEFSINDKLVRGLDYYNDLVFEFISTDVKNLGTQSTIIGGGRYDYLISSLDKDNKHTPAIGYAIGIERLILAAELELKENQTQLEYVHLFAKSTEYDKHLMEAASYLRRDYNVKINYNSNKNLTKRISEAIKNDATYIAIINEQYNQNNLEFQNLKDKTTTYIKVCN